MSLFSNTLPTFLSKTGEWLDGVFETPIKPIKPIEPSVPAQAIQQSIQDIGAKVGQAGGQLLRKGIELAKTQFEKSQEATRIPQEIVRPFIGERPAYLDPFAIASLEEIGAKQIPGLIAKSKNPEFISGLLRKIKVTEEAIPELAKSLVNITKESKVVQVIGEALKAPRIAQISPKIAPELQPLAQEARKYKSAEVSLRKAIVEKTIKPTDEVSVLHGTPYWEDIISSGKGIQSGIRRNTPAALGGRVYVSDTLDNALTFAGDQPVAFKLKAVYGNLKSDPTTVKNIASTGQKIANTTEESILKGGAATLSKDTFAIESVIVKRPDGSYVELLYKANSQELIDKIKSVKQGIPKEMESMAKVAREAKSPDDFISKFKADEFGNFCINI